MGGQEGGRGLRRHRGRGQAGPRRARRVRLGWSVGSVSHGWSQKPGVSCVYTGTQDGPTIGSGDDMQLVTLPSANWQTWLVPAV
jgi:hypothetical protein